MCFSHYCVKFIDLHCPESKWNTSLLSIRHMETDVIMCAFGVTLIFAMEQLKSNNFVARELFYII